MESQSIILKALIKKGAVEIKLTGRCMEPLLYRGDRAKIIRKQAYKKGAICLFVMPDKSIAVHRLVERGDTFLVMKGDRAKRYEIISEEDIIGEVISLKKANGVYWNKINPNFLSRKVVSFCSRQNMLNKKWPSIIPDMCARIIAFYAMTIRKTFFM